MSLRGRAAASPLLAAVVFEAALIPLALVLALMLGVPPWAGIHIAPGALLLAVLATVPLVAALMLSRRLQPSWLRELEVELRKLVYLLFRGKGRAAVMPVALLAGLSEELLFRGVIQQWLVGPTGPVLGLVLAALVFGLAHFATRAYFVLATCMGLYLGALYLVSGNLLVPMLVHALYDWIAIEYLLRRGRAFAPGDSAD